MIHGAASDRATGGALLIHLAVGAGGWRAPCWTVARALHSVPELMVRTWRARQDKRKLPRGNRDRGELGSVRQDKPFSKAAKMPHGCVFDTEATLGLS